MRVVTPITSHPAAHLSPYHYKGVIMDSINNILTASEVKYIRKRCVLGATNFVVVIPSEEHLYAALNLLRHLRVAKPSWDVKSAISYLHKPKGLGIVVRPLSEVGYSDAVYFTQDSATYSALDTLYLSVRK